jgi:hypothetical protein
MDFTKSHKKQVTKSPICPLLHVLALRCYFQVLLHMNYSCHEGLRLFFQSDIDNSRYSFSVEWHDTEASIIRTFILFYYKVDGTIELVSNLSVL